jgi:Co/Zn/Cd efflux system component
MEATPYEVDIIECFKDSIEIEEVEEIHDFHVWSISAGKLAMSAHVRSAKPYEALHKMTEVMRTKYNIFHTSIQVEKPALSFSME